MRRVLVIVIIVLVFLGILTAIIFKVIHPAPTATTITPDPFGALPPQTNQASLSPTTITSTCYEWYVAAYFNQDQTKNFALYEEGAKKCFTKQFMAEWDTIAANSGGDPVVLAQDYRSSWTTHVSSQSKGQTANESTVVVTLGNGKETHTVTAHLLNTSDGWRIANVTDAQ